MKTEFYESQDEALSHMMFTLSSLLVAVLADPAKNDAYGIWDKRYKDLKAEFDEIKILRMKLLKEYQTDPESDDDDEDEGY